MIAFFPLSCHTYSKGDDTTEHRADAFWQALDALVASSRIVIDRPKGSRHPRFPHVIYEVDYGYPENTASMDGSGIDLWRGRLSNIIRTRF